MQLPNKKGDTPLHLGARAGHLRVVKILINEAKKDTESGDSAECKIMVRTMEDEKNTALHEAVKNRHDKLVKLLIQQDSEFEYGDDVEGKTN